MTRTRTWMGSVVVAVVAASALAGCSDKLPLGGGGGGQTTSTSSAGGGSSGAGGSGGAMATSTASSGSASASATTGAGGNTAGCTVDASVIFTLDNYNLLSKFDPATRTFNDVGTVNCMTTARAEAMVVDRTGHAWVRDDDDNLYKVDVTTAACTATSYVPGQHGFTGFGMGIATDGPDSTNETVYLANYDGTGLGKLDLGTLQVSVVGPYDHVHAAADLAGTGDGRLFGMFQAAGPEIGEIDPSNAHVLSLTPLTGLGSPSAWTLAAWGGSLYAFVQEPQVTKVWKYDPLSGTAQVIASTNARVIWAASSSTCAPSSPSP